LDEDSLVMLGPKVNCPPIPRAPPVLPSMICADPSRDQMASRSSTLINLGLEPGCWPSFLVDSLNPPVKTGVKGVCSLILSMGSRSLAVHSLLPHGGTCVLGSVCFSQLKAKIPEDVSGRRRGGLLSFLSGGPQLSNVEARAVLLGERESVLVKGSLEGQLCFWLWDPLSESDECEDEGSSSLRWLCTGPEVLDGLADFRLILMHNERRVPVLLAVSPLGSIYLQFNVLTSSEGEWKCLEAGDADGVPVSLSGIQFGRYDHETISIVSGQGSNVTLSMLTLSGLLIEVGSLNFDGPLKSVNMAFWTAEERICVVVTTSESSVVVMCELDDCTSKLVELHRASVPIYPIWTLYKGMVIHDTSSLNRCRRDAECGCDCVRDQPRPRRVLRCIPS